jgi:glycosyltransferase involved in cell wall biosynthesis
MKKVLIVQRVLTHYRAPFFQGLRDRLIENGVELSLVYGQGDEGDRTRKDSAELAWASRIQNRYLTGGLVWQPCLKFCRDTDLVVVENANRFLINYWLQLKQILGIRNIAFWGHGKNFQGGGWLSKLVKVRLMRFVHWWFTYTEQGKELVQASGFPGEKITVVQNTIDISSLRNCKQEITPEEVQRKRDELQLGNGPVLLYCGGMYREKLLPQLISEAVLLNKEIPSLQLILIGSGAHGYLAKEASQKHRWIHYPGPLFGREKVLHYLLADYVWFPGSVGLGVLDSIALEVPMITTAYPGHGPEIAYLRNGENSIMLKGEKEEWLPQLKQVLEDSKLKQTLVKGCKRDATQFTLKRMVNNFAGGLLLALGLNAGR